MTLDESKALVLAKLKEVGRMSTSEIGYTAFPDAQFKSPQGAARAAGKLISDLMKSKEIDTIHELVSVTYKLTSTFYHGGRILPLGGSRN